MPMQVKDVSTLAGVSVRTLHHYDEIGLLTPASVSAAGYRLYSDRDLEKLQQILFFKEIGFSLQEIKEILDSPGFDRRKALSAHRELLLEKRDRMNRMLETVERTIHSIDGGSDMASEDLFEGFDMERIRRHQEKYAEEARQRWGKDIVEASEQRVNEYSAEKWKEIHEGISSINRRIISRMANGPDDPEVQEAVEAWHGMITGNFYKCTTEIFRGLGNLYVDDDRFTAHYEQQQPGLAVFLRDAMHVYCDRLEGKS